MAVLVRWTLPAAVFDEARDALRESDEARRVDEDPVCGTEGTDEFTLEEDGRTLRFCSEGCLESYRQRQAGKGSLRDVVFSWSGWFRLGNQYRKEWSMIWKDVVAGFLISGFVIVFVPQAVWNALFLTGEGILASAENAVMGVAVAVISFVGSIGNVPFAVALWTGGVSFAGVIAFVYSDLITIPVLNVYRKYYGWKVMLYIFGVFFVTMAASGFLMEELFGALDIIPQVVESQSATEQEYFSLDYTFWLNLLAIGLSAFLYWTYRTKPKGPYRDPVCGMLVPEDAEPVTVDGETYRFCSDRCRRRFERRPELYGSVHPSSS
jgi:YHS domain-containing protein